MPSSLELEEFGVLKRIRLLFPFFPLLRLLLEFGLSFELSVSSLS